MILYKFIVGGICFLIVCVAAILASFVYKLIMHILGRM